MRDKIENELRSNMTEVDAKERTNNIIGAHQLGAELSIDELVDALTPTPAHGGIADRLERERSAYIVYGIIHAN